MNLSIDLDYTAIWMNEDIEVAQVYLVAYEHKPEGVRAVKILELAAGVKKVSTMLLDSMIRDNSVQPHHIERLRDLRTDAAKIIERFNAAVTVTPFTRANGTAAIVVGEATAKPKPTIIHSQAKKLKRKSPTGYSARQRAEGKTALTEDDVCGLRDIFLDGVKHPFTEYQEWADYYKCSFATIYDAVRGRTYRWVEHKLMEPKSRKTD